MLRHLGKRLLVNSCLLRSAKFDLNVKQLRSPTTSTCGDFSQVRNKHVTSGVQGRRSSKTSSTKFDEDDEDDILENDIPPEEEVSLKDRYRI